MRRGLCILLVVAAVQGAAVELGASDGTAHENGPVTITPARDLTVPAPWAGQWRIRTTYRRGDTGEIVAVDDVTDVIVAGEPLKLSGLTRGGLTTCEAAITDRRFEISCSLKVTRGHCHFTGRLDLVVDREGETLGGAGEATSSATEDCGVPPERDPTTIEVSGVRLSPNPGDPRPAMVAVLTRFVASNPMLLIAMNARPARPVIEDDCKDGGWRTFVNPSFKNQGQCIAFVHHQDRPSLPGKSNGR